MKSDQASDRPMVVLELDGAVVHGHTPSELIHAGFPLQPERDEQAFKLYQKESTGNVKPDETLLQYATLARGLSLRRAIEFATFKMRFINGFDTFIEILYQKNVPLILVSSSFSIITETIRWLYGPDRFQAVLANSLAFGLEKDPEAVISEEKLISLVQRYFHRDRDHQAYDKITATGECNTINPNPLQTASFIPGWLTPSNPDISYLRRNRTPHLFRAEVSVVEPVRPLGLAGLRVRGLIVAINGSDVQSVDDLHCFLSDWPIGRPVGIDIVRGRSHRILMIVPKEAVE